MRRFVAILLSVLFNFTLLSPALLSAEANAKLPACCRRDGDHKCGMTSGHTDSPAGPALKTAHCPYFPAPRAVPVCRDLVLPESAQTVGASEACPELVLSQPEFTWQSPDLRSGQQRGPPPSFSIL